MEPGHRMTSLATPERDAPSREAVFVQVAGAMAYESDRLTLVDLAPSTIYITLADPREVGYLPTGEFLDLWLRWRSDPQSGRTPAVLSLLDASSRLAGDSHWLLDVPRISGPGLTYDAQIVRGAAPSASGSCVLVIGPHGYPG